MPPRKVQNTYGRAASDNQHRPQNQRIAATGSNPVPPISGNTHMGPSSSNSTRASHSTEKSYSPVDLRNNAIMLKDAYPWAIYDLIEIVLEDANNDLTQASHVLDLLRVEKSYSDVDLLNNTIELREAYPWADCDFIEIVLEDANNDLTQASHYLGLFQVLVLIVGPKVWNKELQILLPMLFKKRYAFQAISAASNLKREAKIASRRGDPVLDRKLSQQAKELQALAKKLTPDGTERILMTKNGGNDMLTLDLHGLHAPDAVKAVEDKLLIIEFMCKFMGRTGKCASTARQGPIGPIPFHIITGVGNHSKGEPVLPAVISEFLEKKRHRFEVSPSNHGVIVVHLEFP